MKVQANKLLFPAMSISFLLVLSFVVVVLENQVKLAYSLDPSQTSPSRNRPAISLDGDNVFVVWPNNQTVNGNSEIYLARSTEGGASFEDIFNLSNTTERSANPELVKAGENVYVVWLENINNNNWEIFLTASPNNGVTFNEPLNISNNTGISEDPEIAADEENVILTWWEIALKAVIGKYYTEQYR